MINNICSQIDLGPGSGLLLVDAAGNELFCSAPKTVGLSRSSCAKAKTEARRTGNFGLPHGAAAPRLDAVRGGGTGEPAKAGQTDQPYEPADRRGMRGGRTVFLLLALKALLAPLYKIMSLARQVGGGKL